MHRICSGEDPPAIELKQPSSRTIWACAGTGLLTAEEREKSRGWIHAFQPSLIRCLISSAIVSVFSILFLFVFRLHPVMLRVNTDPVLRNYSWKYSQEGEQSGVYSGRNASLFYAAIYLKTQK